MRMLLLGALALAAAATGCRAERSDKALGAERARPAVPAADDRALPGDDTGNAAEQGIDEGPISDEGLRWQAWPGSIQSPADGEALRPSIDEKGAEGAPPAMPAPSDTTKAPNAPSSGVQQGQEPETTTAAPSTRVPPR